MSGVVWRCTKCREERSNAAGEDGRYGHRLSPCDGDMWTEDDWCDGDPVGFVELPLSARAELRERAYEFVSYPGWTTGQKVDAVLALIFGAEPDGGGAT